MSFLKEYKWGLIAFFAPVLASVLSNWGPLPGGLLFLTYVLAWICLAGFRIMLFSAREALYGRTKSVAYYGDSFVERDYRYQVKICGRIAWSLFFGGLVALVVSLIAFYNSPEYQTVLAKQKAEQEQAIKTKTLVASQETEQGTVFTTPEEVGGITVLRITTKDNPNSPKFAILSNTSCAKNASALKQGDRVQILSQLFRADPRDLWADVGTEPGLKLFIVQQCTD